MKIDTKKLVEKTTTDSKLDLHKVNKSTESNNSTKKTSLSFNNLHNKENNDHISNNNSHIGNLKSLQSLPEEAKKTAENTGFSLIFTEGKVYNLDTIVNDKRRDNANCPLILKVNLQNENDKEIIKLITILILDDYLNAGKSEEEKYSYEYLESNYPTLISQVPDFYKIFDSYFNKYYSYYYAQLKSVNDGSISLDTIKETIVEAYNNDYDELLGKTLKEYSHFSAVLNKPQVEYEMGTEQGPNDVVPDTNYLSLVAKDNKLFITQNGLIIPDQDGIPFATINHELILNNTKNFELLTADDYFDLLSKQLLMSNNSIENEFMCSNRMDTNEILYATEDDCVVLCAVK